MRLNSDASAEIFIVFQLTVGTVNIISVLTYNQKKEFMISYRVQPEIYTFDLNFPSRLFFTRRSLFLQNLLTNKVEDIDVR